MPSRCDLLRSAAACLLVSGLTGLGASPVLGQITPPAPGVEMPQAYYDRVAEDRGAFRFKRAWKAQTERVKQARHQREQQGIFSASSTGPVVRVEGTRRVPVLAGKYANTGSDPYTVSALQNQLFDGPNPSGTVTQYYDEISYGYLNLTGDVIGNGSGSLFQVAQNDTYYEGGAGCNGLCGAANTGEFLKELLDNADTFTDFSQYDNDGPDGLPNSGDDDGFVDFVAFVHPEFGGECGGSNMWSHRWVYEGWHAAPYSTNDAAFGGGVIRVSDYTVQPLISCNGSSIIEIGVYAHEFGHAFGLPDLYDTDSGNGTSQGIGEWGLMGSGSYGGDGNHPQTPSHMCAWSKEELGWVDPIVICQDVTGLSLPAVADTGVVYKVFPQGVADTEYFLLENRVRTGFDFWIHTSGIAIWHIDNDQPGNGDENHKLVDLEEADGAFQLDNNVNRGDAGDVYPGSFNRQLFDDNTIPNARDYGGALTGFSAANFSTSQNNPRIFDVTVTQCQLAVGDVSLDDAPCGNNSGSLDGNERADLPVALRNDFSGDITGVSGILTSLTAGVSVLQDSVFFGTVICGVLNYGDSSFEIESTGPLADGSQVNFQLDMTGDAGYAASATFSIFAGNFVLLVEDDGTANNKALFQDAITGAGYAFIHHNKAVSGMPALGQMQSALAVVWYTGQEGFNTFDAAEQALVQQFLDAGGSLFVTGQDIGWGLVDQGTASDLIFYEDYLHANFLADGTNDNTLTGETGDPIGNGISLNLAGGDGADNSNWPSEISARAGASHVFRYSNAGGGEFGALRYSTGHKLVYFAFNFEAINASATRTQTMQAVLDWLAPADIIPPTATLTAPVGGEVFATCGPARTITWTASDNDAVSGVDLFYSTDGGATYPDTIALALANTGTHDWTDPGLSGTAFRVKVIARDPAGLQGVDFSGSDFTIQADPPSAQLLSPNGGESFGCLSPIPITWTMSDTCAGLDSSQVFVSVDGGGAWSFLATVLAPDTTTVWAAPDSAVASARVRVDVYNGAQLSASDTSDAVFAIVDDTPPTVTVIAPNGGESLGTGNAVSIDWLASDDKAVTGIDLAYSSDGGAVWIGIASGIPNSPPYAWTAPETVSVQYLVQVTAADAFANAGADTSDGVFSVGDDDPPTVTVTAPNGGEILEGGVAASIECLVDDNVAVDSVCVSYSLDAGQIWTEVECGSLSFPYAWTPPTTASDSALVLIQVWDGAGNAAADTSDTTFTIILSATGLPPELAGVTRPMLLQNHPNPVRLSGTRVAFYLPEESPVNLAIYDVSGRRVRTLVEGIVSAGYHEEAWNGSSDSGRPVGQGMYFTILQTPEGRQMRKMVKLR